MNRDGTTGVPSLGVVVRSHNSAPWISSALRSVTEQTLAPDEIIVVDDASEDDSVTVVKDTLVDDPRVRLIEHERCRGAAATFNTGVAAGASEYVVVLDGDDTLSPDYLRRMSQALVRSGADFGYAEARLFGATNCVWPARPFDLRQLARENYITVSAMFARPVFEGTRGHREDLAAYEDWEFWLHAVALGFTGIPVSGCWLDYRRHAEGSRNTVGRMTAYRAIWRLQRLHPDVVRPSDVVGPPLERARARFTGQGRSR